MEPKRLVPDLILPVDELSGQWLPLSLQHCRSRHPGYMQAWEILLANARFGSDKSNTPSQSTSLHTDYPTVRLEMGLVLFPAAPMPRGQ